VLSTVSNPCFAPDPKLVGAGGLPARLAQGVAFSPNRSGLFSGYSAQLVLTCYRKWNSHFSTELTAPDTPVDSGSGTSSRSGVKSPGVDAGESSDGGALQGSFQVS
jgi:hypothetical protein